MVPIGKRAPSSLPSPFHLPRLQVRIIAIVVYCLSYVAMLTAYVSGGANLAGPLLSAFGQNLHPAIVAALFATVLGTVVHMGVRQTERLNTVMQVLAFFSFMCLLALGSGFMQTPDLSFAQWGQVSFCFSSFHLAMLLVLVLPCRMAQLLRRWLVSQWPETELPHG